MLQLSEFFLDDTLDQHRQDDKNDRARSKALIRKCKYILLLFFREIKKLYLIKNEDYKISMHQGIDQ